MLLPGFYYQRQNFTEHLYTCIFAVAQNRTVRQDEIAELKGMDIFMANISTLLSSKVVPVHIPASNVGAYLFYCIFTSSHPLHFGEKQLKIVVVAPACWNKFKQCYSIDLKNETIEQHCSVFVFFILYVCVHLFFFFLYTEIFLKVEYTLEWIYLTILLVGEYLRCFHFLLLCYRGTLLDIHFLLMEIVNRKYIWINIYIYQPV